MRRPSRPALLLYVTRASDPHRAAVGPTLAAAAERAGWGFEYYCDDLRRGRHFGGGDPTAARPGVAAGSLVAGGGHAEQLLWLTTHWHLVAAGAPGSLMWPVLEAAGAELLARSSDPAELYSAVFDRLRDELPSRVIVVDAQPQGSLGVVVAPYLYPAFLDGQATLGMDASADTSLRWRLEGLGASEFVGQSVDAQRAAAFPGGLDRVLDRLEPDEGYASLTTRLARRHAAWGRGVLLGDPDLVSSQLPKASRLRLLPLYGQPQSRAIADAGRLIETAREPVFGRQYDDHDFLALARKGRGLQVIDPGPPFDSAHALRSAIPDPPSSLREVAPSDAELETWADEGRVLVSVVFWGGMLRELDCLPRVIDLVAETGLRAGLVVTAETLEHGAHSALALLGVPADQGGVFGLVEPLLGSTGRGVAFEAEMPPGALARSLAEASAAAARRLPAGLMPRGWWPLMDARLVPRRAARIGLRDGRLRLRYRPRGPATTEVAGPASGSTARRRGGSRDLRGLAGAAVRATGLRSVLEPLRPFEDRRPGPPSVEVADAVRSAGFAYMLTKAAFGTLRVPLNSDGFVALTSTAGSWDGWSPFYTLRRPADLARAERRFRRTGQGGWVVSTIDSPLWALPGEIWERGSTVYEIASLAARGGRSGELVNVVPSVAARYARLIEARRAEAESSRSGKRP